MLVGMTGFAEARETRDDLSIFARLNTLNSRFLDLNLSLPRLLLSFEEEITNYLRSRLKRGRINLHISLERTEPSLLYAPHLDETLLRSISALLDNISDLLMVEPTITLHDLLQLEVISFRERDENAESLKPLLMTVMEKLVDNLLHSRRQEGKAIEREIKIRLRRINTYIRRIERIYPRFLKRLRKTWEDRLQELCAGTPIEPASIVREASQIVLRRDFNEELERIKMQVAIFEETITQPPPVGSKLLFILQEASREVNTLSNKALHKPISRVAILMKEEIERIRELVQNVE